MEYGTAGNTAEPQRLSSDNPFWAAPRRGSEVARSGAGVCSISTSPSAQRRIAASNCFSPRTLSVAALVHAFVAVSSSNSRAPTRTAFASSGSFVRSETGGLREESVSMHLLTAKSKDTKNALPLSILLCCPLFVSKRNIIFVASFASTALVCAERGSSSRASYSSSFGIVSVSSCLRPYPKPKPPKPHLDLGFGGSTAAMALASAGIFVTNSRVCSKSAELVPQTETLRLPTIIS
mmetsp:Transcript_14894/g.56480  ORF Transcript_14894/g.56480 Transcript_14894/m.56480 type:complete len:236 (+) Transcript_14894:2744-3451(+)